MKNIRNKPAVNTMWRKEGDSLVQVTASDNPSGKIGLAYTCALSLCAIR